MADSSNEWLIPSNRVAFHDCGSKESYAISLMHWSGRHSYNQRHCPNSFATNGDDYRHFNTVYDL
jgi:hypothetical protein